MSVAAIGTHVADVTVIKASWLNNVREYAMALGQGINLGSLNKSRGYRALSTSYVFPTDYGRVRVNWDRVTGTCQVIALFELIVDPVSPAEEGQVEIVELSGPTQVVEMAASVTASDWTVQTALVIPASTGIKYYSARVKGSDATVGVGMVGDVYLVTP